jgi:hypothetical protein
LAPDRGRTLSTEKNIDKRKKKPAENESMQKALDRQGPGRFGDGDCKGGGRRAAGSGIAVS